MSQLLSGAWWRSWWAWGLVAALFGIFELLAPGYIFLGFAVGASAMAVVFLIGDPIAGWMPTGLPALMVTFAVASILAWVVLRVLVGIRKGQTRVVHHDINDD